MLTCETELLSQMRFNQEEFTEGPALTEVYLGFCLVFFDYLFNLVA